MYAQNFYWGGGGRGSSERRLKWCCGGRYQNFTGTYPSLFFLFSFLILCHQTTKLLTPGGQYNQGEIVKCMIKIFIGGGSSERCLKWGGWGYQNFTGTYPSLVFLFSFLILCYQTTKLLTPGGQCNQDEIVKCMIKIFIGGGGREGVAVKDA